MAVKDVQEKIKKKMGLSEAFSNVDTKTPMQSLLEAAAIPTHHELNNPAKEIKTNEAIAKKTLGRKFPKKMTLHVTEEVFDLFQKVYVNRLVNGRDTEKGELVCEAIKLLYKAEKLESNEIQNLK